MARIACIALFQIVFFASVSKDLAGQSAERSPFDGIPERFEPYDPEKPDDGTTSQFVASLSYKLFGAGSIHDWKSGRPFEFIGGNTYYAKKSDQAILASYGHLKKHFPGKTDDSYDRVGLIAVESNQTPVRVHQRRGNFELSASSLWKLTGKADFFELYANMSIDEAKRDRNQTFKISFLVTDLVKEDLVRAINASPSAIESITYVVSKGRTPIAITSNVIMLDTNATARLDSELNAGAKTIIETGNELTVNVTSDSSRNLTLESPLIRGYQMSEIEYVQDSGGQIRVRGLVDHW